MCGGPDDGTPMICCDACNEWYHLSCINMSVRTARKIAEYYCHHCNQAPQVDPFRTDSWVDSMPLQSANEHKTQSKVVDDDDDDDEEEEREDEFDYKPELDSIDETAWTEVKKRKRLVEVSLLACASLSFQNKVNAQEKKPKTEDPARKKVVETLAEALRQDGLHSASDSGISFICSEIEKELYSMFTSAGKEYKLKYRSLMFNIKDPKNMQLRKKVISGELTPAVLCRMTPQELANEELAQYRKSRDEKLDNSIIKREEDEIIETTSLMSLSSKALKSQQEPVEEPLVSLSKQSGSDIHPKVKEIQSDDTPEQEHKNYDINLLNETIDIPSFKEFEMQSQEMLRQDSSSFKPKKDTKSPSSWGLYTTQPNWRGFLKTAAVRSFRAVAFHINGKHVEKDLPETLNQVGRMDLTALSKYLGQIPFSSSRKLSVFALEPNTDEELADYIKVFEDLNGRSRGAVLKGTEGNTRLKEAFLVPISGEGTIPSWAKGLSLEGNDKLLCAFITTKKEEKKKPAPAHRSNAKVEGYLSSSSPSSSVATRQLGNAPTTFDSTQQPLPFPSNPVFASGYLDPQNRQPVTYVPNPNTFQAMDISQVFPFPFQAYPSGNMGINQFTPNGMNVLAQLTKLSNTLGDSSNTPGFGNNVQLNNPIQMYQQQGQVQTPNSQNVTQFPTPPNSRTEYS